jgi:hypothetical protein
MFIANLKAGVFLSPEVQGRHNMRSEPEQKLWLANRTLISP